jgi:hypothetical protein
MRICLRPLFEKVTGEKVWLACRSCELCWML